MRAQFEKAMAVFGIPEEKEVSGFPKRFSSPPRQAEN